MLTPQENATLTRVGPGTPMGEVLRRYWTPFLLSSELAEPGGPPIRVRLLGENMVAFRDGAGRVGLLDQMCSHRGASLYFGRTEADGLRCAYHGWKYDVDGRVVAMPSEPAQSGFKHKIRHPAYPCRERGGLVWAYLGPHDRMPELPELEWTVVPDDHRLVTKRLQECNWLQAVEGGVDPRHVSFLHRGMVAHMPKNQQAALVSGGDVDDYKLVEWELVPRDCGLLIGLRRELEDGSYSWRGMHYLSPFYSMIPPLEGNPLGGHAWVPIDDENCWVFTVHWVPDRPVPEEWLKVYESGAHNHAKLIPGTFIPVANKSNDYLLDRELQRKGALMPVWGVGMQDSAIQESMGPVQDRTREHLGTSDTVAIAVRKFLLDAIKSVQAGGDAPGLDPRGYRVRGVASVRPAAGVSYAEASRDAIVARSPHYAAIDR